MKSRIQVLSVENRSGRAKTGNDYNMNICQCIVHETDPKTGEEKQLIGELILPKGHPAVVPGMYDGEFALSIGQDKRIGGRLVQLFPVSAVQRSASVAAAPASGTARVPT